MPFNSVIELAALDGTNGFKINGVSVLDLSGFSVASAGDVNADGYDDIIIGAFEADPNGEGSGATYVVFGGSGFGSNVNLSTLNGTTGFKLSGVVADDYFGFAVASAGDVNRDGYNDLIVGAPNASGSGSSYVVFGKASGFSSNLNLSALNGNNGFKITGVSSGDQSGFSVASAGDINHDGYDDIIIGAQFADPNGLSSGASYIVFGKASGFSSNINLSSLSGNNGFKISGEAAGDYSGISVAAAGDVNGDGFGDFIVGASEAVGDDPGGVRSGAAYVVFGKATGFTPNLNLSSMNGADGFKISGQVTYDDTGDLVPSAGISVASAGDLNGDGFDDVVVGAFRVGPSGGASYVVFGKASGFDANLSVTSLDGSNGFKLNGVAGGDWTGYSVASAGDVNGDGLSDLVIGAFRADPNGMGSGSSYVVFGSLAFAATFDLSTLDGTNGFTINGAAEKDFSGHSVASAGDVNNDGYDDLAIGAYQADANNASDSGASYIVLGGPSGGPMITSNGGRTTAAISVAENTTAVTTVAASTPGLTYSIVGGADQNKLSIDSLSGALIFLSAPDYEHATDNGSNNVYDIVVQASDGAGGIDRQAIAVTVTNVSPESQTGDGNDNVFQATIDRDSFFGLAGTDTVSYAQATSGVTANLALPSTNTGFAAGDSYNSIESLTGSAFSDKLTGDGGSNVLKGAAGADVVNGGGGSDKLFGGAAHDVLTGGSGSDRFSFASLADSGNSAASRDVIKDFEHLLDKIDLSGIDAIPGGSDNAFTWKGSSAFSGGSGELRYVKTNLNGSANDMTIVQADLDGDKHVDFQIELTGLKTLTAGDFIL